MSSIWYNEEIWHDDYPPDIRERAGPMSERAKRERIVVAVPFLAILLGGPLVSTLRLKRRSGGTLSFATAATNVYALWAFFNLFDLLILDYLFLLILKPRFAVLPGTEGMNSYQDYRFPFVGFLKGLAYGLVPSLLIALIATRRRK